MKQILIIKLKIAWRAIKEMPVYGYLILGAIIFVLLLLVYKTSDIKPINYLISCIFFIILLMIGSNRKDISICRKLTLHPYCLYAVEYFFLSLPFIIVVLINKEFLLAGLYSAYPFVTAAVPQFNLNLSQRTIPFILKMPSAESVSFFRKYRIMIWLLLAAAVILCFATGISIILVYFLTLFYAGSAFSQSESVPQLCLPELSSKKFLRRKITGELKLWSEVMVPILLLYIPFNIETAYYSLIPLVLGPAAILSGIYIKYARYSPLSTQFGSVFQALCMLGYIFPVLLPFTLIITIKYRNEAIYKLSQYLDAYYQ